MGSASEVDDDPLGVEYDSSDVADYCGGVGVGGVDGVALEGGTAPLAMIDRLIVDRLIVDRLVGAGLGRTCVRRLRRGSDNLGRTAALRSNHRRCFGASNPLGRLADVTSADETSVEVPVLLARSLHGWVW